MPDCPSDFALLRFFEGLSRADEVAVIVRHLQACRECREHLEALAIARLRADARSLPPVADRERRAAMQRIADLASQPVSGRESAAATDRGCAGFGLGAALTGLGQLFTHPLLPGLAAGAGESLSADVRNHSDDASILGEHSSTPTPVEDQKFAMPDQIPSPNEPDKVFGNPPIATPSDIHQLYQDTCAIRSQEIVLRDFGINISEDQLRAEAFAHGWYQPGGGTSPEAVGNLLELHGVSVHRFENANIFNLQNELAQGHRVIVGVDSGELWSDGFLEKMEDKVGLSGADHALVVSSIDTSDPDHVKVVLTDPGSGQVAAVYSQEQFQDAWKDSNGLMVSTAEPAPAYASGMQHFDYAQGHVNCVGTMPYDLFSHYLDYADGSMDPAHLAQMADIYHAGILDYSSLLSQLGPVDVGLSMPGLYDDIAERMMAMVDPSPEPLPVAPFPEHNPVAFDPAGPAAPGPESADHLPETGPLDGHDTTDHHA